MTQLPVVPSVPARAPLERRVESGVIAGIEAMVRTAPEQYLWIHRRFKRQPDGGSAY